jgi:hypothetical protein
MASIRILMTSTAKGAVDSTDVREFAEGREYDVPEDLAAAFFEMGVADPAEAHEGAPEGDGTGEPDKAPAPAKRSRKGKAQS